MSTTKSGAGAKIRASQKAMFSDFEGRRYNIPRSVLKIWAARSKLRGTGKRMFTKLIGKH